MQRKKSNRSINKIPCVLTIAGSDSGGGAGIQADLKTFAAIGVHGTSAITCITGQNPTGVRNVQPVSPQMVHDQISAVLEAFQPQIVKTGMLYSAAIIEAVNESVPADVALIVDPVMIATSGALLLKKSAVGALHKLLRRAALVTPNLHEAEYLLGRKIQSAEELRRAAREFHEMYRCAALMKGGHLTGMKTAVDFLFDGNIEWLFESPFIRGVSTHGTGCTYSAAIAAHMALGNQLCEAVLDAKEFISNAIGKSYKSGNHQVLNTEWNQR